MKRVLSTLLALLSLSLPGWSQSFIAPDTILIQDFNSDPQSLFAPTPSGSDQSWVNYDEDGHSTFCGFGPQVPGAWYWEGSFEMDASNEDYAMTSCSYFVSPGTNNNWLILPPVPVPDAGYTLHWESLPYNGPAYMDGYEVLISAGSNDPASGDFQSVFEAAEMLYSLDGDDTSLDVNNYQFSDGYIHADGYTLDRLLRPRRCLVCRQHSNYNSIVVGLSHTH